MIPVETTTTKRATFIPENLLQVWHTSAMHASPVWSSPADRVLSGTSMVSSNLQRRSSLHAELPSAGKSRSISVHMLLCKCELLGDVARRAFWFLFYGISLAVEGLLTSFLPLCKALANLVSMAASVGPCRPGSLQHDARDGPRWVPTRWFPTWELFAL